MRAKQYEYPHKCACGAWLFSAYRKMRGVCSKCDMEKHKPWCAVFVHRECNCVEVDADVSEQ